MALTHRRGFLRQSGLAAAGLPFWSSSLFAELARTIRITEIEAHEVLPPYHEYHAEWLFRYQGLHSRLRTVYIVKTDAGLEGYGENWGSPWSEFKDYLGTSPFDWINDPRNLPMNMALYDLMGKALGLPAWKLIGPRVRSWVPIAAWTMSQPPRQMAEEVRQLSKRGYRWVKYHVDVLQNVVDQTAAMQEAAPRGFRVQYDFNEDSNFEAVYPVLKELERFPIAGRIEDPIRSIDRDGYRLLREKCAIPILIHHGPAEVFMRKGLSDGFMASHAGIGSARKLAAMAESTNTPFLLQMAGGTINQAFLAHEAAVFKMAILDHVSLCHLWKEDVTVETMPVVNGSVQVLGKPGLGVTLDRDKLRRLSQAPRPRQDRFLVRMRYRNGFRVYFRFDPDAQGANIRFLSPPGFGRRYSGHGPHVPGPVPGYANPVETDFWDEVGTAEFERMWKRTEAGPVWKFEG
jgi:L-alanine-DL-glutamate epimerase-like enolase superfamily enzyme